VEGSLFKPRVGLERLRLGLPDLSSQPRAESPLSIPEKATEQPSDAPCCTEIDPPVRALVVRLTRAETDGNRGQAGRIAASLTNKLMERGRYHLAVHWAEWSIHLHELWRARSAASYGLCMREWALAKLVLGQTQDLEQVWGPGLTRIPSALSPSQWFLGGLGSLILVRKGSLCAAAARCEGLWRRASQRRELVDLVNAYVQVLLHLGKHAQAHRVAEKVAALTGELDPPGRARSLLACGIAFSADDREKSRAALEGCRRDLAGVWRAQATLYLAHVYRASGNEAAAHAIVEECVADLREISPTGLALLASTVERPEALLSQRPCARLELRFLGGMEVHYQGRMQAIRLRFAEFLALLARHPEGLSAEQLALAVYGEAGSPASCKTELSRLKQVVPIGNRPYRLRTSVEADFLELPLLIRRGALTEAVELYRGPLLPRSDAPEIRDLRTTLEESLRIAVLATGNPELLWSLASRIRDDLEVWEVLRDRLADGDPRRALAQAQISSLQRSWAS
jgi:hypothetical protein